MVTLSLSHIHSVIPNLNSGLVPVEYESSFLFFSRSVAVSCEIEIKLVLISLVLLGVEFQRNHIKFLIKINAVMVIIKCDNAGLWCNINRGKMEILLCVLGKLFSQPQRI